MKFARTSLVALLIPTLALVTGCDDSGKNPTNTGGQGGQGGENQGGGGSGGVMGGSLSLDTSYGDQGIGRVNRMRSNDQILAATFTSDGSLILGGSTDSILTTGLSSEPLLVRLTPAGQLDTTFGGDGFAVFPVGSLAHVTSLVALPDGRVLAGGSLHHDSETHAFVIRVDAQGKLDPSFGTSGITTAPTDYAHQSARMTQLPSGVIMVLAKFADGGGSDLALFRFNAHGQPDTMFGAGGYIGLNGAEAHELLVDSNGKLLALANDSSNGLLYRFNADGSPDATFGTNGSVTVPFVSYDVEENAAGELLVGGLGQLMKLDASGKPVTTFGVGGVLNVGSNVVLSTKSLTNGDLLVTDGKIVSFPSTQFVSMRRLDANGNPVAFDDTATKALGSTVDFGTVLVKNDQAFLAGGRRTPLNGVQSLAVSVGIDGVANATFGMNGVAQNGSLRSAEILRAMAMTSTKSIMALGYTNTSFLTRMVNGAADASFAMGGFLDDFGGVGTGMSVDAQDRVVTTVGTSSIVRRYDATGKPDATFGMNGVALKNGPGIMLAAALDSKQRIVAGGYNTVQITPTVVRLLEDGNLDASFGVAGVVTDFQTIKDYPVVLDILGDSKGNVVVAGRHDPPPGLRHMYVVRLLENGTLDPAFGTAGALDIDLHLLQPVLMERQSGGYWLVGHDFKCTGKVECAPIVVAIDANGKLDASFGEMGLAHVEGAGDQSLSVGLAELPDGSLVVAGAVYEYPGTKFAVWRLGQDGSADPKGPFVLPGKGCATSAFVDGNMLYVGGWAFSEKTGTDMVTLRFGL